MEKAAGREQVMEPEFRWSGVIRLISGHIVIISNLRVILSSGQTEDSPIKMTLNDPIVECMYSMKS